MDESLQFKKDAATEEKVWEFLRIVLKILVRICPEPCSKPALENAPNDIRIVNLNREAT